MINTHVIFVFRDVGLNFFLVKLLRNTWLVPTPFLGDPVMGQEVRGAFQADPRRLKLLDLVAHFGGKEMQLRQVLYIAVGRGL